MGRGTIPNNGTGDRVCIIALRHQIYAKNPIEVMKKLWALKNLIYESYSHPIAPRL